MKLTAEQTAEIACRTFNESIYAVDVLHSADAARAALVAAGVQAAMQYLHEHCKYCDPLSAYEALQAAVREGLL